MAQVMPLLLLAACQRTNGGSTPARARLAARLVGLRHPRRILDARCETGGAALGAEGVVLAGTDGSWRDGSLSATLRQNALSAVVKVSSERRLSVVRVSPVMAASSSALPNERAPRS